MPHVTLRYERSKLYQEVWAQPVTRVAKSYGISDVGLRKICRKLGVPMPPLGYWAKLAAGKRVPTPPLPRHSGPTEIVRRRFVSSANELEAEPPHLVARREFEARPENRIVVSASLGLPHPLIVSTERALRRPKGRNPRSRPARAPQGLDIAVSEDSLPRALRIMDALVQSLDARGMPLRIEPDGERRSCVTLLGQELAIRLVENTLRVERQPTDKERREKEKYGYVYLTDRYSYQPTGLLKLGILSEYHNELQKVVADGKQRRIEQCLNEFIVKLEAEAARRKQRAEELERQHRLWEEQEKQRRELEERRERELAQFKRLEEQVRNWRRAEEIRGYVAAVEGRAAREPGAVDCASELSQWAAWARAKADSIDPLRDARSAVLDTEDDDAENDPGCSDDHNDDRGIVQPECP